MRGLFGATKTRAKDCPREKGSLSALPDMADLLIFGLLSVLALVLGTLWAQRRLPAGWLSLFVVALALRAIGSTARLEVMERVYSGVGDARMYFEFGRAYAEQLSNLNLGFITGEDSPTNNWWGSQFVRTVTAFVVFLTSDSLRGTFFVFSLFAFTGLVLCVLAFDEATRQNGLAHARWVWLMPSLWFWPSSIGKEALMLLAAGLAVYGYVGREGRPRWWICACGIFLAGALRPHVAAVVALSILIAESIRPGPGLSARRIGGLLAAVVVLAASVQGGLTMLNLDDADLDGIQEQFEFRASQTSQGGSKIALATGWSAAPMAFITILMRPFPWEAQGAGLLSSAEITLIWVFIFARWRGALELLRNWRSNAYLRFGLPFLLAMSLMYGLAFANLGIIARQRAVILPFLLTFLHRLYSAEPAPALAPTVVEPRGLG
jgi:hypothetical protein